MKTVSCSAGCWSFTPPSWQESEVKNTSDSNSCLLNAVKNLNKIKKLLVSLLHVRFRHLSDAVA